ncbi:unnamed protein product, partial [Amoebophrya sp. A25]
TKFIHGSRGTERLTQFHNLYRLPPAWSIDDILRNDAVFAFVERHMQTTVGRTSEDRSNSLSGPRLDKTINNSRPHQVAAEAAGGSSPVFSDYEGVGDGQRLQHQVAVEADFEQESINYSDCSIDEDDFEEEMIGRARTSTTCHTSSGRTTTSKHSHSMMRNDTLQKSISNRASEQTHQQNNRNDSPLHILSMSANVVFDDADEQEFSFSVPAQQHTSRQEHTNKAKKSSYYTKDYITHNYDDNYAQDMLNRSA